MNKLGNFRSPPSQYHTMEKWSVGCARKKSGPQDRLKLLLMSEGMRVDEARPLANLVLNACKRIDVDFPASDYQNIREAPINGNGDFHSDMSNLVGLEFMKSL
jgi:hypothetical protein